MTFSSQIKDLILTTSLSLVGKRSISSQRFLAFSLVELLFVVILLGVIAGLALPNFSHTFANIQLKQTAQDIAFLMRYGQSRAIMKSKAHRLEFDMNNSKYWLTQETLTNEEQESLAKTFQRIPGRIGRIFRIPKDLTVESDNQRIQFYPDGIIDKCRIYLHNKNDKYFTISTYEQAGYVWVFDEKVQ